MHKWLKSYPIVFFVLCVGVAGAATIQSVPLVPRALQGTDKVPVDYAGNTTAYTANLNQIKAFVFSNNTTVPGVYTFNGRDGAVAPQAGDYTAAQVGADPSGTAAAAVATHNATYNHLNIPTNQQIGAMTGTSGTPSTTNAFVTNADPRNSNARTPTAHASSHTANGADPLTLATSQVQGLDTALAGKQALLSNAATLGKITEAGNLPLWNGGAWPGGEGGGGDMYKATYDPNNHGVDAFNRANHTGTQPSDSITGLAASATTDTTTTANITSSTNKRFVTDAQQSVLINTSGTNSGDVTLGTANGLLLTGQQLSLQLATNAQSGALSAVDHTSYAQAASLAATALQPASTLDATKLSGTAAVNTTGTASNVTGTVAIANGGTGATTAAAARTALGAVPTTTTVNGHALSSNVSVTAADVGLGSVNNTSDAAKPVSTATQAALDLKAPVDNPTFTTGVTAPVFISNAADGTHFVQPYNSTTCPTTCNGGSCEGALCTLADGNTYQHHSGVWAVKGGGSGGTWGSITGTLTDQTDLNSALGLKAPKASPTFTGTVTLPITGSGNQCVRVSAAGVVSGTGSDCGTGTGGGSGTVNNSSNAYHLAGYAATGTTVSDTGITYSADGTTITTAQGTAPDALTLRPGSANGTSGVTLLGPSGATTAYSLQFPTAAPTAGQIPVFGTPASGIVPVTWGSGGGGGGSGTVTQIIAASPLTGGTITSSGTIGISQASGSVSGYLSSTDWTTFNGKAPQASPTFTGTVTLPITGSGNQCVRVSSTGVVSGTGSDCGTGSGSGSGTVNNSSNAYHLAGYAATGTTVSDSGITYATDGSTITTAKVAGSADAQLFRAAADLTGAGIMGPSASTTTPYYLQLPATPPTNGQVAIFGTSASGTVNGVTANIVPVTYGSGSSMVYPSAGVPVSTGSAWGTSLNITAISDSTGTTSSTTAASSTAVKSAYDLAATKGTGTVTPSTTDTLTNKTYDTAGTGNVLKINGTQVTDKTGTGKVVLDTSPTLVNPNIGAATATSVVATGLIDGTAPTALTTVNDYVLGSTYKTNYTFNNYATAPQTIVYRLPAPVSGRTECVRNYTGKTNVLQVQALASTYIDMDGVVSASTGYVASGGALGDAACFVGVDANHWVMYAGKGTWTLH